MSNPTNNDDTSEIHVSGGGIDFGGPLPLEMSSVQEAVQDCLAASRSGLAEAYMRLHKKHGTGLLVIDFYRETGAELRMNLGGFKGISTLKYASPRVLTDGIRHLEYGVEETDDLQKAIDLYPSGSFPVMVVFPHDWAVWTYLSGLGENRFPVSREEYELFNEYIRAVERPRRMT